MKRGECVGKISTPVGTIEIMIDGKALEYDYEKLNNGNLFPDFAARYKIKVSKEPDGTEHEIKCVISGLKNMEYISDIESGECLECQSFYIENCKISVGIESDAGYLENGFRITDMGYDYDSCYIKAGISYCTLSFTTTKNFVFGVCWMENYTKENEHQTWFGAAPTIM